VGCRHASAEDRTIGLDGVVAQQDNYRKSGFEFAYRTVRYGGVAKIAASGEAGGKPLTAFSPNLLDTLSRYDEAIFQAPRRAFLAAWCGGARSRTSLACLSSGRLRGYGTIRRCFDGHKIGPLFADTPETAATVLTALVASGNAAKISLDVPLANPSAVGLAESFGLSPVFETARMYRGTAPKPPLGRMFGVTTLELG
jgi:hypothetical protein